MPLPHSVESNNWDQSKINFHLHQQTSSRPNNALSIPKNNYLLGIFYVLLTALMLLIYFPFTSPKNRCFLQGFPPWLLKLNYPIRS